MAKIKWIIIGVLISLVIWFFIGAFKQAYYFYHGQFKYIDCTPEELLPDLEDRFKINFPEDMQNIQTAKNKASDSNTVDYVAKFTIAPNIFEKFLTSFPEKIEFFEEFTEEDSQANSYRYMAPLRLFPEWFRTPITKGKNGMYGLSHGEMRISVDISNETNQLVYLSGWYIPVN